MCELKVKRVLPNAIMPTRASEGSAGYDLYCSELDLWSSSIDTGVAIEIPVGYFGLVIPRSSTGSRGFRMRNTAGIIDSDYRGPILIKYDGKNYIPHVGEKIAQLLIIPCLCTIIKEVEELSSTSRDNRGFGSSGG